MSVRFAPAFTIIGPGHRLHFEGNSKITGANGSFDCPAANSFSLVAEADCPGSTATCRASCYVQGIEHGTTALYAHNSRALRAILGMSAADVAEWTRRVARYISRYASGGFRWHVSGDVFSMQHARFIADVARLSSDVPQWIYTRSFDFVSALLPAGNLAINLSCDVDNYAQARFTRATWRNIRELRLCYLSSDGSVPRDLPPGSVIFPDYALRGRDLEKPTDAPWWQSLSARDRRMVCPVDFFGASKSLRCGPCKKCLKPGGAA